MHWPNLKKFECPHCANALRDDGDEIRCTNCRFHIDHDRFRSIKKHRGRENGAGHRRMKWQNLHDGKCPADASVLSEDQVARMLTCPKEDCTFRISEDRLKDILADKNHIAHRFHVERAATPTEEDNLAGLSAL